MTPGSQVAWHKVTKAYEVLKGKSWTGSSVICCLTMNVFDLLYDNECVRCTDFNCCNARHKEYIEYVCTYLVNACVLAGEYTLSMKYSYTS